MPINSTWYLMSLWSGDSPLFAHVLSLPTYFQWRQGLFQCHSETTIAQKPKCCTAIPWGMLSDLSLEVIITVAGDGCEELRINDSKSRRNSGGDG